MSAADDADRLADAAALLDEATDAVAAAEADVDDARATTTDLFHMERRRALLLAGLALTGAAVSVAAGEPWWRPTLELALGVAGLRWWWEVHRAEEAWRTTWEAHP